MEVDPAQRARDLERDQLGGRLVELSAIGAACASGNAALRCARPRERALEVDEAAVAAERTDSERVGLVDLSSFMCDEQRCFPVVGGALVIKDIGHMTRTFARTLGPYLGRAIVRLQASRAPRPAP